MNFEQLLSRADDELLGELIGTPVVRLLRLIDQSLASPSNLRKLLLELRPPGELLREPASRSSLIDTLQVGTATELVEHLGLNQSSDPFTILRSFKPNTGSALEERLFGFFGETPPTEIEREYIPDKVDTPVKYGLFDHQRRAVAAIQKILRSERNRLLLHMPTGSGKTRTAMNVVCDELRNHEPSLVIWLAYSEELCEQAANEFATAWDNLGNRQLGTFRFWGTHDINLEDTHDGLIVASLDKTFSYGTNFSNFLPRLGDRCSLVVMDEAHAAIAPTYSFVLDNLVERKQSTGLLGLSATPGRTWNDVDKDQELADFFLRQKVTLNVPDYPSPVDYLIEKGYLAKPTFEPLFYESGFNLSEQDVRSLSQSLDISPRILERVAEDEQRNLAIVYRLEQLVERHQRIIVFAASVRHAQLLAVILRARGINADAVIGTTPPHERNRLISRFRGSFPEPVVLCNYGVLTAGFDAPRTSAAVIARPTKSLVLYSQMLGRALRGTLAGGNDEAEIITVVDTELPGFRDPAETFFNWEDVWV